MKILGRTVDGDLIISVSEAEWSSLQAGVKPSGSSKVSIEQREEARRRWLKTEVGRFFQERRGTGIRGRWGFFLLFENGQFDGTLESFRDVLNDKFCSVPTIGETTRARLLRELDDYIKGTT